MKTKNTIALCLLVAATACASFQEESVTTERTKVESDDVFYATLEQSGAADATKVYADANLQVLWNADDRISIYNCYTYGYEYAFQGATGKTAGAFAKVAEDAEFVTGNPLDKIYAVYPYSQENDISNTGELNIRWPSTQTYKPDSFGIGSNVMVSVTTNNQLRFRNVGGYLALKLYGDNVSVTSITLRGNNGEKLSGKATITCATDEDPTLSFDASGQGSLRLNCAQPVTIGTTAEDATVFWLVVPPTQFTHGFNITVRTNDGRIFVKSTDTSYDIERNTLCRMAAVKVVPSDIIPFEDANFKAYCVANFDTNKDGEVSLIEAIAVTTVDVCTDNVYSLGGIEFFTNLNNLYARGSAARHSSGYVCGDYTTLPYPAPGTSIASGKLSVVDISDLLFLRRVDISSNNLSDFILGDNPSLQYVSCDFCNITELDLSHNTSLTWLFCGENRLTSLDVSNNTALITLHCGNNQLASLDVSRNANLSDLRCYMNQLMTLDVSSNTNLTDLLCFDNILTSLDISNNTNLTTLWCCLNHLTSLDISNNPALTDLDCRNNQLTMLDVSQHTALTRLGCGSNPLTALDISNNTALTYLDCEFIQLTALDISQHTALSILSCRGNPLTTLDVTNNTALTELHCEGCQLTELDVSNNTLLSVLDCSSNQLTNLDVSNNTALTSLWCGYTPLSSLDVSNNTALIYLRCYSNHLTCLDVSNNTALTYLDCSSNPSLSEIWLKTGQSIEIIEYDCSVAQVYYKD